MPSSPAATANFLSRATALIDRGFSVIPITPRGKNPAGPGATGRTRDLDLVKNWAAIWPDANVAICADDEITILESDDAARFLGLLEKMGVTLPETMTGGANENRPHWFFKRTPECGEDCITVPGLFEFRNGNQYVVGPGSIHPSGAEYRWWKDAPTIAMPTDVLAALRQLRSEYRGARGEATGEHVVTGPFATLRNAYMRLADPADLLGIEGLEVGEDERHYTLVSLAGLLHDGERTADDIAEILRDVRDEYFANGEGTREVGEAEVAAVAQYAVKQAPFDFEPWDLPSFAVGTIVFRDQSTMEKFLREHQDDFSTDWTAFRAEDVPEQDVLIHLNGVPLVRQETINEVFAYRGLGKSMFVAGLIKILAKGGEFCGLQSTGGRKVLLVDGELPKKLLQTRLDDHVGPLPAGLLRVRGLAQTKNSYMAPLAALDEQEKFMKRLAVWRPDVIVFDTKTAVFKHDTNDQPQLLAVNEFLMRLRAEGYAVIMTHHAGKNGSQRGRTDNDDITDLIIKLDAPKNWTPGDGMQFNLSFEKVRYGDRLEGFSAKWTKDGGWERTEDAENVALGLLLKGKSINAIAKETGLGNSTVAKIKAKAIKDGALAAPDSPAAVEDKRAEAARLAAEGKSQRQIAEALGVSQSTVNRLLGQ
jgi:putative DNA primase/helicase